MVDVGAGREDFLGLGIPAAKKVPVVSTYLDIFIASGPTTPPKHSHIHISGPDDLSRPTGHLASCSALFSTHPHRTATPF